MAKAKQETGNLVYAGRIEVPYAWSVGATGSRFLTALRDDKEIWGAKCPKCKRVYVYPVKTCGECFVPTEAWVKVENVGTLESFTVVHYKHDMQPRRRPLVYGLVKLDDADGALLHLIGGVEPARLQVGMRLKAVFARKRTGSILDIQHFAPA
jgi:hypothetical protein